jgi:hypothetical protein
MEAIKRDFSKSLKIFETNCDLNSFPASCFKAGSYRAAGRACPQDMVKPTPKTRLKKMKCGEQ